MAQFLPAYDRVILEEGGYVLTNAPNDRGGMTYAGISRRAHPKWEGWKYIDRGETPPVELVRDFYYKEFWWPIKGDMIEDQKVAEAIYTFAVHGGQRTASIMAQVAAGATPDGKIGQKSVASINAMSPARFRERFCIAMITRYRDICVRDKTQRQWIIGWLNRALKVVE